MKLSQRITAISMLIVIAVCMSGYVLLLPIALEELGLAFLVPDALKEIGLTSAVFSNNGDEDVGGGTDSPETLEIADFVGIGGGRLVTPIIDLGRFWRLKTDWC